jgi:4a-hydroxytetrahydrobiopterin dehydratase
MNDFSSSMAFLQRVAEVAEQEGHHPDLHLEGYRNVWIEIFTHSTGGITERDLQLGARIDALARGGRVV